MNPKKPIENKIFDREFKKWLIAKGFLIKSSYSMNELAKICKAFQESIIEDNWTGK